MIRFLKNKKYIPLILMITFEYCSASFFNKYNNLSATETQKSPTPYFAPERDYGTYNSPHHVIQPETIQNFYTLNEESSIERNIFLLKINLSPLGSKTCIGVVVNLSNQTTDFANRYLLTDKNCFLTTTNNIMHLKNIKSIDVTSFINGKVSTWRNKKISGNDYYIDIDRNDNDIIYDGRIVAIRLLNNSSDTNSGAQVNSSGSNIFPNLSNHKTSYFTPEQILNIFWNTNDKRDLLDTILALKESSRPLNLINVENETDYIYYGTEIFKDKFGKYNIKYEPLEKDKFFLKLDNKDLETNNPTIFYDEGAGRSFNDFVSEDTGGPLLACKSKIITGIDSGVCSLLALNTGPRVLYESRTNSKTHTLVSFAGFTGNNSRNLNPDNLCDKLMNTKQIRLDNSRNRTIYHISNVIYLSSSAMLFSIDSLKFRGDNNSSAVCFFDKNNSWLLLGHIKYKLYENTNVVSVNLPLENSLISNTVQEEVPSTDSSDNPRSKLQGTPTRTPPSREQYELNTMRHPMEEQEEVPSTDSSDDPRRKWQGTPTRTPPSREQYELDTMRN